VRRAFLCGEDHLSGRNFDHRRGWIESRIRELAAIFAIDVAAYAVMSNHYHVVVRVGARRADGWSTDEVLVRWTRLFTGPLLVRRYLDEESRAGMDGAEIAKVEEIACIYRARLYDLSWFMRMLNECIARQANAEDEVTGRFWEGRFKSQALLDEQALLAAMAYVDLNPVRAGLAETPEAGGYTSIHARLAPQMNAAVERAAIDAKATAAKVSPGDTAINDSRERLAEEGELAGLPRAPLMPFDATARLDAAIPFGFDDYLELVDSLGRCVHPRKRGYIPEGTPKLLDRLGIDAEGFIAYATHFLKAFGSAVGTPAHLVEFAAVRQVKFLHGMKAARQAFERKAA